MSDFTNEAIQVSSRLEEIAELLANGDLEKNESDSLYYERAELEEKDRYLSAYFALVNKNQELQTKLDESEARVARLHEALHHAMQCWQYDGVSDEHGAVAMECETRLNETESESLAEIQAASIEYAAKNLEVIAMADGIAYRLACEILEDLAETAMREANSDGCEYDVEDELASARLAVETYKKFCAETKGDCPAHACELNTAYDGTCLICENEVGGA